MTSRAGALPPFSIECVLAASHSSLRALAGLPPSHILASSTDGGLALYGPHDNALHAELHYDPPPTKKPIDRLVVLPAVGRAIVLSEGVLSFHGIPQMEIVSAGAAGGTVNLSNLVKGVSAFAVDDPSQASVRLAIAKRKSLAFYIVTSSSIEAVKELPLPQPLYLASFRRNAVCVADRENYSIIDLVAGDQIPLLPINQEAAGEGGQSLAAPSIAAVGGNEFLIASHTATGSLGLFVKHSGDPCRGTITWNSRVRSLAVEGAPSDKASVDQGHILALLRNNTIEVHSLADTNRPAQVISLEPEIIRDPRALVQLSEEGLDFTGTSQSSTGGSLSHSKVALMSVQGADLPPSTPPHRARRSSSMRQRKQFAPAHTLLQCKSSIYAIQPLTLLVQAEALLADGRAAEASSLADSSPRSETTRYIHFRAAMLYLAETKFEEAGECFVKAMRRRGNESQKSIVLDPRLILRMWPDLRGELGGEGAKIEIWAGAEPSVHELERTIDSLVLADLYRNYSPHVKPDIEHAPATVALRTQLLASARAMTMRVLQEWRSEREQGSSGSRKLDKVHSVYFEDVNSHVDLHKIVDTALAKLLVEEGDTDSMMALLLAEPSNVQSAELIDWLRLHEHHHALANVLMATGRQGEALPIWVKLYDATVPPDRPPMSLSDIEGLVRGLEDASERQHYALWFLSRHRSTGLKLLAALPTETSEGVQSLLDAVAQRDGEAADELTESFILLKKPVHADLQTSTIVRLLQVVLDQQQVAGSVSDPASTNGAKGMPFLEHLMASKSLARLKLDLFLTASPSYDAQQIRDRLERSASLAYERAIVYGRLKLHRQALATLTLTMGDLLSAEAYCSNRGTPISAQQAVAIAELLHLRMAPVKKQKRGASRKPLDAERRELVQMLVDMCLQHGPDNSAITQQATVQLISKQAMHLSITDMLSRAPDDWSVHDLTPFVSRALRRSLDESYETQIIKALAAGHNLLVSDELYELQARFSPVVASTEEELANLAETSVPVDVANKVASELIDKSEKLL